MIQLIFCVDYAFTPSATEFILSSHLFWIHINQSFHLVVFLQRSSFDIVLLNTTNILFHIGLQVEFKAFQGAYSINNQTPQLFDKKYPFDLHCVMPFKNSFLLHHRFLVSMREDWYEIVSHDFICMKLSFCLTLYPIGFRKMFIFNLSFHLEG